MYTVGVCACYPDPSDNVFFCHSGTVNVGYTSLTVKWATGESPPTLPATPTPMNLFVYHGYHDSITTAKRTWNLLDSSTSTTWYFGPYTGTALVSTPKTLLDTGTVPGLMTFSTSGNLYYQFPGWNSSIDPTTGIITVASCPIIVAANTFFNTFTFTNWTNNGTPGQYHTLSANTSGQPCILYPNSSMAMTTPMTVKVYEGTTTDKLVQTGVTDATSTSVYDIVALYEKKEEKKEDRKQHFKHMIPGGDYMLQLIDEKGNVVKSINAVFTFIDYNLHQAHLQFFRASTDYPCVTMCSSTAPYSALHSSPAHYDEVNHFTIISLSSGHPAPEVGTTINLYRWNTFTDPNPRYETTVTSVVTEKTGTIVVLKDHIQAPYVTGYHEEKRDEKAILTCVAFAANDYLAFYSNSVTTVEKKITIGHTHPKEVTVTKDQNLKVYLLTNFMNYAAAWTTVVSTSPLVLTYTSPIALNAYPANLMSSSLLKSISQTGKTVSDPQGALHADDDFDFPVVTRTQRWKIQSNDHWWTRGSNEGELSTGSDSLLFTVEQGLVNNQVVFSDGKGSYLRAVKTLPYVVLEFGANKNQATNFTVTWVTQDKMILSSSGSQSSKRCHKSSSRTWVTHGSFVYLTKKQPSDSVQDKDAVLTVHRH